MAPPTASDALALWRASGSSGSAGAVQIPSAPNLSAHANTSASYTYIVTGPFPGTPDAARQGLPPVQPGVQSSAAFTIQITASNIDPPALTHSLGVHRAAPHLANAEPTTSIGPIRSRPPSVPRYSPYNSQVPSVHSSEHSALFNLDLAPLLSRLQVPILGATATGSRRGVQAGSPALASPQGVHSGLRMLVPSNAPIAGTRAVVDTICDHYCVLVMTLGPDFPNKDEKGGIIREALVRTKLSLRIEGIFLLG